MKNSVYSINKGINRPVEFRGLKAQYITYLAIGLVALLLLFVALYVAGADPYLCLLLVLGAGAFLIWKVFRLSHRYGQHGLMKLRAKRSLPIYLYFNSRKLFNDLKTLSQTNKNSASLLPLEKSLSRTCFGMAEGRMRLGGDAAGSGVETYGNRKISTTPNKKDREGRL